MSNAITQSQSIDQVASAINAASGPFGVEYYGGYDMRSPEQMAAEYAYQAAEQAGYGIDADTIDAHLEYLVAAGAIFNRHQAINCAIQLI